MEVTGATYGQKRRESMGRSGEKKECKDRDGSEESTTNLGESGGRRKAPTRQRGLKKKPIMIRGEGKQSRATKGKGAYWGHVPGERYRRAEEKINERGQ